ncbi:MAG: kinase [Elusimicrobiota bacterium]
MIITRTPFRISFFGGGSDYPVWLKENPGAVLSTTIDKFCYITCRYLPPFFTYKHRIVYSRTEHVGSLAEVRHPSVRECLRLLKIREGLEIHHDGDLPARTGIGSSSSFTVGLLNCLNALKGGMTSKAQLAAQAIRVEQDLIGESVGCQDQIAASYGGFNLIELRSKADFRVTPVTLAPARLAAFKSHLMLFFTGFSRTAEFIAREQVRRTPSKTREIRTLYDMVFRAVDILNRKPMADFGALLHEAWMLKRGLTDQTSTPQIDAIYSRGRRAGALGGKLLGAGGGGFMLLFVPPCKRRSVRKALKDLLHVPFSFESQGSQVIVYRPEEKLG